MHWKRVTCELHDSYFCSMMIKTCHSKDVGSCVYHWPFIGRDWVGVELLYNSVHRKFNQLETRCGSESQHPVEGALRPPIKSWGSDELETRCSRENQHPERLGPWPPVEQPRRTGKKLRLWPIEWRSICCSSVQSPTSSHTQSFQMKWEVYFSKELCRSSLLCRRYDFACICRCICIMCLYSWSWLYNSGFSECFFISNDQA